jgi:tRNA A-37 threonylcarbamoyl transferase component Bud32
MRLRSTARRSALAVFLAAALSWPMACPAAPLSDGKPHLTLLSGRNPDPGLANPHGAPATHALVEWKNSTDHPILFPGIAKPIAPGEPILLGSTNEVLSPDEVAVVYRNTANVRQLELELRHDGYESAHISIARELFAPGQHSYPSGLLPAPMPEGFYQAYLHECDSRLSITSEQDKDQDELLLSHDEALRDKMLVALYQAGQTPASIVALQKDQVPPVADKNKSDIPSLLRGWYGQRVVPSAAPAFYVVKPKLALARDAAFVGVAAQVLGMESTQFEQAYGAADQLRFSNTYLMPLTTVRLGAYDLQQKTLRLDNRPAMKLTPQNAALLEQWLILRGKDDGPLFCSLGRMSNATAAEPNDDVYHADPSQPMSLRDIANAVLGLHDMTGTQSATMTYRADPDAVASQSTASDSWRPSHPMQAHPRTLEICWRPLHEAEFSQLLARRWTPFVPMNPLLRPVIFHSDPEGAAVYMGFEPQLGQRGKDKGTPAGKLIGLTGQPISIDMSTLVNPSTNSYVPLQQVVFQLPHFQPLTMVFQPQQLLNGLIENKPAQQPLQILVGPSWARAYYDWFINPNPHKPAPDAPLAIRFARMMYPTPGWVYDVQWHPWLNLLALLALGGMLAACYGYYAHVILPRRRQQEMRAERERDLASVADFNLKGKVMGNYMIVDRLGSGGMATVYKAYPLDVEYDVAKRENLFWAIKLMNPDVSKDAEFRDRFMREVTVSTKLDHPTIVRVKESGEQEDMLYLVMELIDGDTLEKKIPRGGMMPRQALNFLQPILDGIAYAHEHDIIHRDLKPENIMITKAGNVKIMDFGLARKREVSRKLTKTGTALGTPAYMAPEQIQGDGEVDPRSDQYSLGIMAYELICGRTPFIDEDAMAMLLKHITEPPPSMQTFRPDVPDSVNEVILKMIAKDPNERFASVHEALDALNAAVLQTPRIYGPEDDIIRQSRV